jgi:hypothetical protein
MYSMHLRRLGKDICAREDLSFSSITCRNLRHRGTDSVVMVHYA